MQSYVVCYWTKQVNTQIVIIFFLRNPFFVPPPPSHTHTHTFFIIYEATQCFPFIMRYVEYLATQITHGSFCFVEEGGGE